jgi:hypothetical protein
VFARDDRHDNQRRAGLAILIRAEIDGLWPELKHVAVPAIALLRNGQRHGRRPALNADFRIQRSVKRRMAARPSRRIFSEVMVQHDMRACFRSEAVAVSYKTAHVNGGVFISSRHYATGCIHANPSELTMASGFNQLDQCRNIVLWRAEVDRGGQRVERYISRVYAVVFGVSIETFHDTSPALRSNEQRWAASYFSAAPIHAARDVRRDVNCYECLERAAGTNKCGERAATENTLNEPFLFREFVERIPGGQIQL